MRLIFVTHDSRLTGATKSLLSLISELKDIGHEIMLLIPEEGELSSYLKKKHVNFQITGHRTNTSALIKTNIFFTIRLQKFKFQKLVENYFKASKYKQIIQKWNPDYIITNTSTTYFGALLANISGVNHIWYLREFGELDHGFSHDFETLFKSLLNSATINICISKALESYLVNKYQIINTRIVYNGVYTSNELSKLKQHAFKEKNRPFTFIFLGQITVKKGVWKVFDAFISLIESHNLRLIVVGDGPELPKLKAEVERLKLNEIIEIVGYTTNVDFYLRQSDCFIMASDWEAFGRTTIEAVANNCLVLANAQGATSELFEENKEALFFNGTIENLTERMQHVLTMKYADINRIKEYAIKNVEQKYTTEVMGKSFVNIVLRD